MPYDIYRTVYAENYSQSLKPDAQLTAYLNNFLAGEIDGPKGLAEILHYHPGTGQFFVGVFCQQAMQCCHQPVLLRLLVTGMSWSWKRDASALNTLATAPRHLLRYSAPAHQRHQSTCVEFISALMEFASALEKKGWAESSVPFTTLVRAYVRMRVEFALFNRKLQRGELMYATDGGVSLNAFYRPGFNLARHVGWCLSWVGFADYEPDAEVEELKHLAKLEIAHISRFLLMMLNIVKQYRITAREDSPLPATGATA